MSLIALSSAVNERMLVMKDVAGYKALHHLPVEDLSREQNVLEEMLKNARAAGLAPDTVEPFVRAMMDAGKAVQYRYLADWLGIPGFSYPSRELSDTRLQIQRLDERIMTAISQRLMTGAFSDTDMACLAAQMSAPHLSEADEKRLLIVLSLIQRAL